VTALAFPLWVKQRSIKAEARKSRKQKSKKPGNRKAKKQGNRNPIFAKNGETKQPKK